MDDIPPSGAQRLETVFAAAAARHPGILVPTRATSPMDACSTVSISARLIASCEPGAPGRPEDALVDDEMRAAAAGIRPVRQERSA